MHVTPLSNNAAELQKVPGARPARHRHASRMEPLVTGQNSEAVVLLHGLGRGAWCMVLLGRRLAKVGYRVFNLGYPRRADSIATVAAVVQGLMNECGAQDSSLVHFVTHSFGGLVLRAYLSEYSLANVGRAVMLAPPNGGSEIVDRFGGWRLFGSLMVPLAAQLGTGPDDLPANLPLPTCEFGVIAGRHWINPIGPLCLPSPHDGTVSVRQTRLAGMKDHLVVPHNHTFMMDSKQVALQVIHFLRHGIFERPGG